ncbi:MAG: hypothetical protein IJ365_03840, partial [Clostridia bacterium]|nr:hypothetical protein [Clostridia bacterium]
MKYTIQCNTEYGVCLADNDIITYTADNNYDEARFSFEINFPNLDNDAYIMMPACAYNGNKFKRVERSYPPMYHPEEAGADCKPLITNVPALNSDGSGSIEVTSGDMATPCVGIFDRNTKTSFFLFTEQQVKGKNIGFDVQKDKITVNFPSARQLMYKMCRPEKCAIDNGVQVKKGETVTAKIKIHTFECSSIAEFCKTFFKLRKCVMSSTRAPFMYTRKLWDVMENHFNTACWSGEFYAETSHKWQCGWVGGGMSNFPLIKHGNAVSRERGIQTIEFMTSHQAPSGFFYGNIYKGEITDDSFGVPGMEHLHMTRKSADGLYFLFKNFTAVTPEQRWIDSARKCADAFVKLFDTYGTFGQFIIVETGEMVVGCSASAAIACGALVSAYRYFGDDRYLKTAKAALRYYYNFFMKNGYTNGGPGEILSAPDSESAFGLLESCVVMYECDKDKIWLDMAEVVACYCSSWVMTYAYRFPETSEFYRLGINTTGSVFANVQNKHSAPGICTLSGDSLLKLYKYTKNDAYLELIKDIAYYIPQSVSTEEKPIFSLERPRQRLNPGDICERVNTSDWEYPYIGEVFNGSCWCETSLILSFVELMTDDD